MTADARQGYGPTKMTSSEAFVESLVAEGITKVPGIVGSAFMDALDLFPGIEIFTVARVVAQSHPSDGDRRFEPDLRAPERFIVLGCPRRRDLILGAKGRQQSGK